MQGINNQIVFFEFEEGIDLPDHKNTYPQWGMVIDGKMELRIDGQPRICQKGDEYYIPSAQSTAKNFSAKPELWTSSRRKAGTNLNSQQLPEYC